MIHLITERKDSGFKQLRLSVIYTILNRSKLVISTYKARTNKTIYEKVRILDKNFFGEREIDFQQCLGITPSSGLMDYSLKQCLGNLCSNGIEPRLSPLTTSSVLSRAVKVKSAAEVMQMCMVDY